MYRMIKLAVKQPSPTMRGQKKKVSLLLSLNRYSSSRSEVIANSSTVAAMYCGVDAAAKHTNPTSRVTYSRKRHNGFNRKYAIIENTLSKTH